jgi:hypothetical protein
VGGDAVADRGVIAPEETRDLRQAVATFGVTSDAPPQLLASTSDAEGAGPTAKIEDQDTAALADLLEQRPEVVGSEVAEDRAVARRAAH